jgi:hypothetical protein
MLYDISISREKSSDFLIITQSTIHYITCLVCIWFVTGLFEEIGIGQSV